jgi:PAS domain S-box-containing protein
MVTRAPSLSSSVRQVSDTGAAPIPEMELDGLKTRPKTPNAQAFQPFETLGSVIRTFGEFSVLADSSDTIVGFWSSRDPRKRAFLRKIIGRSLCSIFHPVLVREIRDLARNTAAQDRRCNVDCPVTFSRKRRWFAVCAIPLTGRTEGSMLYFAARDVTDRIEATNALAEREELLAQAEQLANFGSWEADLKNNRVKVSRQMMKIYDLAPGRRWSASTYWKRMHPSDRMRVRQLVDKSIAEGKPFRYVARYCAPDGRVRVHLAHSLPLLGEDGKVDRAVGVIQDVTDQAQSHEELRRLSQQLMNEQDNQRRHLARELHESAGQSLAALKMTLGRLREAVGENVELAASLLESARALADGAVREVRTVTYLLHPPMLDDAGLGPALRWYVQGFAERSGIVVQVEIDDPFPRHAQEIETTVFRVVQEALTNVHRYSGSARAEVKVWQSDRALRVEVRDFGCGFPPLADATHRRTKLGVGISGMRERVEQLDGIFDLNSIPGEGTTIRVSLPSIPVNRRARAGSHAAS